MMYVATLIGSTEPLREHHIKEVQERVRGDNFQWLSDGRAADILIDAVPDNYGKVRYALQQSGVDIVIQPAANRRKRLLVADMDSTIILQECIDEMAAAADAGQIVSEITARAMNGEIDFDEALRQRVKLLKDMPANELERVWQERINFTPGAETLVSTMKKFGCTAVLISGGFTAFTRRVAETLGFDRQFANTLLIENGVLTGTVSEPVLGKNAKVEILQSVLNDCSLSAEDVIAVGDGSNDIPMLSMAGTGIAFHAKPAVNACIPMQIRCADLTALLYVQGYSQNELVNEFNRPHQETPSSNHLSV